MERLEKKLEGKLIELGKIIVDNEKAKLIVEPYKREKGYWFGGGKIRKDKEGKIVLTGRYRNSGDSRYGIEKGERGLELAIFISEDKGKTFKKVKSFTKKDLKVGKKDVLSIEGSSIYFGEKIEIYV
ncbi:MAG: exo-alpha-sialidase, partial [Candidatus Ratteibacteria bacterium]